MSKIKKKIRPMIEITIGVIIMCLGFYFFFTPLDLVVGGVSGLSLIFSEVIDKALLILIGNIICLFIGVVCLGKNFFFKTIYGTLLMPIIIFILEICFDANYIVDKFDPGLSQLVVAVLVGGGLCGLGLGICFKNNVTTGGIDVIQKVIAQKFKIPYSIAIYITDGLVVLLGLYTFGLEKTFYGVISIFFIGVVIDKISVGGKSTRTVHIITKKPDEIRDSIYEKLNRGVTYNKVQGGYSSDEYTMVICTLEKIKSYELKEIIKEIDESAFTYVSETHEVIGVGFDGN
ncbi:MAG: YitT family protein [bacterium]